MTRLPTVKHGLRETGWFCAMTIGLTGLSYASLTAWAAVTRLWRHQPIDSTLFRQSPFDMEALPVLAIAAAIFGLELLTSGWKNHSLRRLLVRERASDRVELFYTLANISGANAIFTVVMTFGLSAALEHFFQTGGLRLAATLPLWAAVPLALVMGDFCGYWGHRLMHSRLFWPLHAIHHASEDMTGLTVFRSHPLDTLAAGIWFGLPLALAGFAPEAVLIASFLVVLHGVMIHAWMPYPAWLEPYLCGPRGHWVHHGLTPEHHDTNFAAIMLWDRLFGTYMPFPDVRPATGVADPIYNTGRPVHEMIAVLRVWIAGLIEAARPARTAPPAQGQTAQTA